MEKLKSSDCVILYGPPGIGKTSNSVDVSYRIEKELDWNIQWFSAETKEKFESDLRFYMI